MAKAVYRRNKEFVHHMAVTLSHLHNGDEIGLSPRRLTLLRSLKQNATPRQQQLLYLYYSCGLNYSAIAKQLALDESSVCRTIKRGEEHALMALELTKEKNAP